MRPFSLLVIPLLLAATLFAADLKVQVLDPDQRPVANARATLYRAGATAAIAVRSSNSGGTAAFENVAEGAYRVEILAPGFAVENLTVNVPAKIAPVARLRVAGAEENVVVAATRVPVPEDVAGTPVETLTASELQNMQPPTTAEAMRFLPGAIVNTAGQRGGVGGLFVQGGESRFNQVIVDGVPVKEPGGTFLVATQSLAGVDSLEFVRGAQSTLYGADAMTSATLIASRQGTTRTPELRFGADGGGLGTAHGFANFSGVAGLLDYNVFGDQFNTQGRGANDTFSLATMGANVGVAFSPATQFRFRTRHTNSRSGVQGEWVFGGRPLLAPDLDQFGRINDFLASAELQIAAPNRWQHRFTAFESNDRRFNADTVPDRTCAPAFFFDCRFTVADHFNRAGISYQGEYQPRSFATTIFGYDFEDQVGQIDDAFPTFGSAASAHGKRLNHAAFVEQIVTWKRLSLTGGVRFVHNGSFGNRAVPRVSASVLALRGGSVVGTTRLRFSYAEGINAATFDEQFGEGGFFVLPNPALRPETNRSFETGVAQEFFSGRIVLAANYFNNRFGDLIAFDQVTPLSAQFVNLNSSMAHGAEVELHARVSGRVRLDSSYVYTSSQVLFAPTAFDPVFSAGQPLLRRPRHAGSVLLNYAGRRWGGDIGGSFVGRRADSDFLFGFGGVPAITHAAGYALVNAGGWLALNRYVTAYANIENLLDRRYEEVVGYPALPVNVRAGLRFRLGGD